MSEQPRFEQTDHCSCPKPHGAWGDHGWHLRPMDRSDIASRFGSPYLTSDQLLRAVEAACRSYLGMPIVYERCPAYEAAVQRQRAKVQSERRSFT